MKDGNFPIINIENKSLQGGVQIFTEFLIEDRVFQSKSCSPWMHASWDIFNLVLPVYGVIFLGIIVRRLNWLTEEAERGMTKVAINLLYPCLIFMSILGNPALERLSDLSMAPILGWITIVVGLALGRLLTPMLGGSQKARSRTFAFTVGIYNYGLISLPLAMGLFGQGTVGMLFLFNIGVEVAFWTLGMLILTGASARGAWKHVWNVPIFAVGAGVLMNVSGAKDGVPHFVSSLFKMLGPAYIPIALLLIGMTVFQNAREGNLAMDKRVTFWACVTRLGILPLVFLALAVFLPCSKELKQVIVLQAAMPAAFFPIVMTRHYGGDVPTALRVVLGTSLLSLITIPFWIHFGMRWILSES